MAEPRRCIIAGCGRPARSMTFCRAHEQRARKGEVVTRPIGRIRQRRQRDDCRCPNAAKDVHAIGCPGGVPPMAESDHPVLLELLDRLMPEVREGESLFAALERLKRDAAKFHEVGWNREGRDLE